MVGHHLRMWVKWNKILKNDYHQHDCFRKESHWKLRIMVKFKICIKCVWEARRPQPYHGAKLICITNDKTNGCDLWEKKIEMLRIKNKTQLSNCGSGFLSLKRSLQGLIGQFNGMTDD